MFSSLETSKGKNKSFGRKKNFLQCRCWCRDADAEISKSPLQCLFRIADDHLITLINWKCLLASKKMCAFYQTGYQEIRNLFNYANMKSPTLIAIFYSSRTLCLDPTPLVRFHTFLGYPLPPLEAYVLFEWPSKLITLLSSKILSAIFYIFY